MKRVFFLLAMAAMGLNFTAQAQKYEHNTRTGGFFTSSKTVKASKNYVTKEMRVKEFNRLATAGSIDVEYTQRAGAPKVEIYTSDNILPVLNIEVKGKTLEIGFKSGYNVHYDKLRIRVNSAEMKKVSIAGSGDVKLTNGIKGEDVELSIAGSGVITGKQVVCNSLEMEIAGSGDITLNEVDANQIEASIAGSGDIKLTGKAHSAQFEIAGSGDIDAKGLDVEKVEKDVAGSGSVALKE